MRSDSVIYGHDGQVVNAAWKGNAHTLLQHLREERRLTGTKEGCAEGDCGACMVLLGELTPTHDSVSWRSVNACFLPLSAVHGKLLATVESIGRPSALHPVQTAMVEEHASQCGFCTPGFVVSLYEHYLRHRAPTSVEQVHGQLSGNLCRCTGYAPILRAAESMYRLPRVARDAVADVSLLLRVRSLVDDAPSKLESDGECVMFPRSSDELAAQCQDHPDARLLGGSTDVGLWVTKQLRTLPKVIHISRADDLRAVSRTGSGLRIGAAVCLADAAIELGRDHPELSELWQRFASPAVRHVATLAGNIANGSPIGDSMPALMVLGARVMLRAGGQRRVLSLEDFYLGYQRNALRPGEFIEAIDVPARPDGLFLRAYKISKRHDDDISAVSLALALQLDQQGRIAFARIALGGMAATVKRAPATEAAMLGKLLDQATMRVASRALSEEFQPISDHRASAAYRMRVAGNLLLRAALEHAGETPTRVHCTEGAGA
ncbi:MAG: xanthine dehydrogenase small subunit [Variovorax sp.]|nr:xanthine dehydrogenase small subunit [Variovorax sp.]